MKRNVLIIITMQAKNERIFSRPDGELYRPHDFRFDTGIVL